MKRNLGFFTCYGIEYVYDYLGKERVNQKIEELKDKPTMGTTLEKFTYGDPEYSYYGGTGVLHIFGSIIHQWFDDTDFLLFLIERSKKYNPNNYFEGGLLNKKSEEYLEMMDRMVLKMPDSKYTWESNKINPFWLEYHFFYSYLFKKMITEEMINSYLLNFKEISLRIEQWNISSSPNQVISNGCMWAISSYYESKGDTVKANEISKLNNSYRIWRDMPEDDEEDL